MIRWFATDRAGVTVERLGRGDVDGPPLPSFDAKTGDGSPGKMETFDELLATLRETRP